MTAQACESSCPFRINRSRGNIAVKNCASWGYGFECLVFCSLRRKATHVRRGDHLRMTRESRRRHLVGCPAHVERTAGDQPLVECVLERDFVDEFAARCIDEK